MEQFQGPGACLVVESIIREGFDDASQEKGQSCLFSWNGNVNALIIGRGQTKLSSKYNIKFQEKLLQRNVNVS